MSLIVFVGPSYIGKTFTIREWLLPQLMHRPGELVRVAPASGYDAALVHDPPTGENPHGQYPGQRFRDVAEWRRAPKRQRICCLENPSATAMAEVGQKPGRLVLVIDELERLIGSEGQADPAMLELFNAGRNYGSLVVGSCRRLMNINAKARANLQLAYFGAPSDAQDRVHAARAAQVDPSVFDELGEIGTFVEWRAGGQRAIVRVVDRRRVVLRQL